MQLKRFFTTEQVKNIRGYIDSQKKYEVLRTLIYFGISLSLFLAGFITTKTKTNLLTVVAVLGCLPASKSLVSVIMFLRYKSAGKETCDVLEQTAEGLDTLYDLIFTTEKITYEVVQAAYKAKCLVLFSEKHPDANALEAHISEYLKRASIRGVKVKVFSNITAYTERLQQLKELERDTEEKLAGEVMQLLKEITL